MGEFPPAFFYSMKSMKSMNLQNTPRTRASLRKIGREHQENLNQTEHSTDPGAYEKRTSSTVLALSKFVSTAPQLCPACTHEVCSEDAGLQCDICNHWEHLSCSTVRKTIYNHLQNLRVDQILYICSRCTKLRKNG